MGGEVVRRKHGFLVLRIENIEHLLEVSRPVGSHAAPSHRGAPAPGERLDLHEDATRYRNTSAPWRQTRRQWPA